MWDVYASVLRMESVPEDLGNGGCKMWPLLFLLVSYIALGQNISISPWQKSSATVKPPEPLCMN